MFEENKLCRQQMFKLRRQYQPHHRSVGKYCKRKVNSIGLIPINEVQTTKQTLLNDITLITFSTKDKHNLNKTYIICLTYSIFKITNGFSAQLSKQLFTVFSPSFFSSSPNQLLPSSSANLVTSFIRFVSTIQVCFLFSFFLFGVNKTRIENFNCFIL